MDWTDLGIEVDVKADLESFEVKCDAIQTWASAPRFVRRSELKNMLLVVRYGSGDCREAERERADRGLAPRSEVGQGLSGCSGSEQTRQSLSPASDRPARDSLARPDPPVACARPAAPKEAGRPNPHRIELGSVPVSELRARYVERDYCADLLLCSPSCLRVLCSASTRRSRREAVMRSSGAERGLPAWAWRGYSSG